MSLHHVGHLRGRSSLSLLRTWSTTWRNAGLALITIATSVAADNTLELYVHRATRGSTIEVAGRTTALHAEERYAGASVTITTTDADTGDTAVLLPAAGIVAVLGKATTATFEPPAHATGETPGAPSPAPVRVTLAQGTARFIAPGDDLAQRPGALLVVARKATIRAAGKYVVRIDVVLAETPEETGTRVAVLAGDARIWRERDATKPPMAQMASGQQVFLPDESNPLRLAALSLTANTSVAPPLTPATTEDAPALLRFAIEVITTSPVTSTGLSLSSPLPATIRPTDAVSPSVLEKPL